jgi:hypothetical protein
MYIIFYVYNIRFRQAMAPCIPYELYSINSFSRTSEMMQGVGIVEPTLVPPKKPAPLNQPAMTTNIDMAGWLLAMIQNNPIILVPVAGVIVVVG